MPVFLVLANIFTVDVVLMDGGGGGVAFGVIIASEVYVRSK